MPVKTEYTILDPRMNSVLEACGLRRYEDYLSGEAGEVVGRSASSETRRIRARTGTGEEVFYLKAYDYRGRRLRSLAEKGRKEVRNYRILRERCGVPVPDVVSHGWRRRGWRLLDAFILTRGVPNSMRLDEYVRRRCRGGSDGAGAAMRRHLLETTADLVSRMHAAGFFHIDLQWRNLLVSEDGSRRPRVYVIDSVRGGPRRWRLLQMHGRLRDLSSLYKLARFQVPVREQVGWLWRYLGVRRLRHEHRVMIQTILCDRRIKDNGPPS